MATRRPQQSARGESAWPRCIGSDIRSVTVLKRCALFLAVALTAFADPATDIQAALRGLGRTSYSWQVTARARMSNGAPEPGSVSGLSAETPLEVEGKVDPDGFTEITLLPSRETIAVPVTAVFKFGDAVGQTPLGWLRRTEIHEAEASEKDRMISFGDKSVRLSRAFAVALRVMSVRT